VTRLAALVVVLAHVHLGVLVGQLGFGDHQIVLLAFGRVRAQHHPVDGVVLTRDRALVRQPLARQRWPLERVGDDEVVEEGRVLLPDLVLRQAVPSSDAMSARRVLVQRCGSGSARREHQFGFAARCALCGSGLRGGALARAAVS
jgi:hypothetical protein